MSAAAVTIVDDDDPAVTASFGSASYSVSEGGEEIVTVTLSADPEREVAVPLSVLLSGGASAADYSGVPGSVTFASGATVATFAVAATDDDVDDDGESLELSFGAPLPAGVSAGAVSAAAVTIVDDDDPAVTASFGSASYSVSEGGEEIVTVTLSAAPERAVAVPLLTAHAGGIGSEDYSGVPGSVTFGANETVATFAVSAAADDVDDDGEVVELSFGALPAGVSAGAVSAAAVTIVDDDDPAVTASFGSAGYSVAEGGQEIVTVTLSAAPERAVAVPLLTAHAGGIGSEDYSGVPLSVTFGAAETLATFAVSAAADDVDDDGEVVELSFGALPAGVSAGSVSAAAVTIVDDDDPAVTASFGSAGYSVAEGGQEIVTVTLSADPEREVTVPLLTAHAGGIGSEDYSGVPGSVTFGANETEATFAVSAAADDVDDDGEVVELSFGALPAGVSAGAVSAAAVTIVDDDDPAVTASFGSASYEVAEGGQEIVTVTLSAAPERAVAVPLLTAHAGGIGSEDYSGVPLSVTFGAAETLATFAVSAAADDVDDDGEVVELSFGALPAGVSAGAVSAAAVTIVDDDDPAVTASFGSAGYSVAEGGQEIVTVTLSAAPEREVTVPLLTAHAGGIGSEDYSGVPGSVTFGANETVATFAVSAAADDVDDDGEVVELSFGALPAGVSAGAVSAAAVTIVDDDDPQVTASFGSADYSVSEGGQATVTVTLSADPERSVVIPLSVVLQGGAEAADYSGVPGSVTFASGATMATFAVAATDDDVDDDGEVVELSFGDLPAGVTAGSVSAALVTIVDDDDPAVTASFGSAGYSVAEGGQEIVTVTLSAAPEREVAVPLLTAHAGGIGSEDYSGVPLSVTFGAAETMATFAVSATADDVDDDGESLELSFGTLPAGVSAGSVSAAAVTIVDDDDPQVTASFGSGSYEVSEGGQATVTVTLSADPERSVVIPLSVVLQGGAEAADYSGVPGSVTFASGATMATFAVAATDDDVDDDGESLELSFGALPAGVSAGVVSAAAVTIVDDDDPAVTASFGSASYEVAEGGQEIVTVTLSAAPEREVTVPLLTAHAGGIGSEDYSGVPLSVTFGAAETMATFAVSATADDVDDDGESLELSFGTLPAGVSAGSVSAAAVTIVDDDDPQVTASFGSGSYEVSEGGQATVTVTLSADPERSVVIPLSVVLQGGAEAADYSGVPGSVTFASGATMATFAVAATDDDVDDDGESLELSFGALPAGVSAGSVSAAAVTIVDDDDPAVTASFGSAGYSVAEGGQVVVTVTLSAAPEREVTVPLLTAHAGGIGSEDYSGVPLSVTFGAAETLATFAVSAAADDVDDDGEAVELSFGALPAGVSAGPVSAAAVTIVDDDDPAVTASFGSAGYSVAEGGQEIVTVTLSAAPEREVTVPLLTAHAGGIGSEDYSGVPGSVTFGANETVATFAVSAAADDVDDDGEVVELSFGALPAGVSAGAVSAAAVTIVDDDDPQVTASFGSADYSVSEGGQATVTVTLSADPERSVVIPLSVVLQGGAEAADYSGVPGSVTFASGATMATFAVAATDDDVDDDGEVVELSFGDLPAGVTAGSVSAALVTIVDDDDPAVTASFGSAGYSVAEGGQEIVTVTLSAAPEREVAVPLLTAHAGGIGSEDYSGVPLSVTFGAAETMATFAVSATADDVDDDGESLELSFGTLPAGVSAGSVSAAAVTIVDDDDPQVTASFGSGSYEVSEGGQATVTVTLSADPERSVVIPLSVVLQGGAEAADYSGVPGSVTFASGATMATFAVAATDDDVDDDGESLELSFGALPAGVSAGVVSAAAVTIVDDDDPAVTASFGSASYEVAEGGQEIVTVTLSAAPEREVTVPLLTAHAGGIGSEDYSGVPLSVTFGAAETMATFAVSATADDVDDDGESLELSFGTLPAGVSAGSVSAAAVTIVDDDDPQVTASFGSGSYEVSEGGQATVTVTLSADPERSVVIPLSVVLQGGAEAADYSGVPGSVTFASGATMATFAVAATDDDVDDDGESLELSFGALPAGVSAGVVSAAAVTIVDDDDPAVTASFGSASYEVAEGGQEIVTVTLSAAPEREVTVPLLTAHAGGIGSEDYSGVPLSVTFGAAETMATFAVSATADDVDDDGESLELSFGTLPAGVSAGSVSAAAVTIVDDDDPQVTASFGSGSYEVSEGGQATVTVTLSADPERSVVIPLSVVLQGGAEAADYSGVPGSVTFASGATMATFAVAATDDDVDDDGESLELSFGALPAGVSAGSVSAAAVTIVDDDDPAVTASFGSAGYSVAEGGQVVVTVTLSAAPEREVTVPLLTAHAGGIGSEDYSGVPLSVTFGAAETLATFAVSAAADDVDDDGEAVELSFGALPAGVSAGPVSAAAVTIVDDDDPAVTASFGSAGYSVAEGGEEIVTVTLSADPEREVAVPLLTAHAGGIGSEDYSGVPLSVTFGAAETLATFAVSATADDVDDDGEVVELSFGALPAGVSAGPVSAAAVTIVDDDDPAVTASFGSASYSVTEGGQEIVTVTLSAAPEREVAVPLLTAHAGGIGSEDYSGVPLSVTFGAAETLATFAVSATADDVDDDGEVVELSFGALPAGVSAGSVSAAAVTIVDDDDPAVTASFGSAGYSVAEGGQVVVTVTLSAAPEREVAVPLTVTLLGGASAADYSGVPAAVVFGAAETTATFAVVAADDDVDDDGEVVELSFGALPAGVTAGSVSAAAVTIVDDDDPQVTASFGSASYSVAEGGQEIVTVTLSAAPEREVAVPLLTAHAGGSAAKTTRGFRCR